MNTNQLKKFAQEARKKLIGLVGAKLEKVLTQDSVALRTKASVIESLKEELSKTSKEVLIDKVAYTWFNRLVALRFMDANDFQPLGINVLSPAPGIAGGSPQLLSDIQAGILPSELNLDTEYIMAVLNRTTPSNNPDDTVFRLVLIAVCNDLHRIFPFLFERIDDYTELLLPDDLTSSFSIVSDIVNGMSTEDCQEVEIIGWLYQFYISELNAELISSKKVYKKEELAPASQLFTPKWIVQYMVDNTLGQLIVEQFPNSEITNSLEFYINPAYTELIPKRKNQNLEDIKFFEPCVGSGHILSYAFDVFYKAYEEQGYTNSEIPSLIIKNNLFGIDIDPRAAQMAGMVLMMKARQKYRRFFRSAEKDELRPNIFAYQNFNNDNNFNNASALGSLIEVTEVEAEAISVDQNSLFTEDQQALKNLYTLLSRKYDVVVTNPPYISSSRMEPSVKKYVETNWKETKSDLFATFILRCLKFCKEDGFTGYMTPFVWMFISSYEKLRDALISKHLIHSLIQLEYSGFDGATVPICTFTLRNNYIDDAKGSYIRLSDFKGSENQAPKTLEAIQNPKCGWFYTANQKDFEKIPGSNIGYWLSEKMMNIFSKSKTLDFFGKAMKGLDTCDNLQFIRDWNEVNQSDFSTNYNFNKKWFTYQKGGEYRRWYGNNETAVNWLRNGEQLRNFRDKKGKIKSRPQNIKYYFKKGITWSAIGSSLSSYRVLENSIFGGGGNGFFPHNEYCLFISFLNSKLSIYFLKVLNPTLNNLSGDLHKLPIITKGKNTVILNLAESNINLSKQEWNSRETSWDFVENELTRIQKENSNELISDSMAGYISYWRDQFFQLHQNEETLNREFIEIYELEDELTPDVPLEDITLLKDETKISNGELIFQENEIIAQLISYAVGCIFGRYSLDKEGLILANQGENLADYIQKVGKGEADLSFIPDEDNVVPLLDEEWFDDDIVNRVREFISAVWGADQLQTNIDYIEQALGKDLRKYLIRDFYKDHIKRYKKRPIYWMFSSPKGSFNVLIYMHRYTQDTISTILNGYLRPFMEKIRNEMQRQQDIIIAGSASEQGRARKREDQLADLLMDCEKYEHDILYPLAGERISIDLDDGVLVNYNKFGEAIAPVAGLNDTKTKKKVKGFDWIDTTTIR